MHPHTLMSICLAFNLKSTRKEREEEENIESNEQRVGLNDFNDSFWRYCPLRPYWLGCVICAGMVTTSTRPLNMLGQICRNSYQNITLFTLTVLVLIRKQCFIETWNSHFSIIKKIRRGGVNFAPITWELIGWNVTKLWKYSS